MIFILKSKKEYVLPNFLCIGVLRCGTTWLYKVFKSHPEIYVCSFNKETQFFDKYYYRGLDWYRQFFPIKSEAYKYKAIGEIVPTYIYEKEAIKNISKDLPNTYILIIMRNPMKRAYSEYKYNKLYMGFDLNFKQYLKKNPIIIERGLYGKLIKNLIEYIPKKRILFLIFEEVMKYPKKSLREISTFLNIEFNKFSPSFFTKKINPSFTPRFHKLYVIGYKIGLYLNSLEMYKLTFLLSKFKNLFFLFRKKKEINELDSSIEYKLYIKYKEDINLLEKIIKKNLNIWKLNKD